MRSHKKYWPALIVALPALIAPYPGVLAFTPLLINKFPDKLASDVPNKKSKFLIFFASFFNVSPTLASNEQNSLIHLNIFTT